MKPFTLVINDEFAAIALVNAWAVYSALGLRQTSLVPLVVGAALSDFNTAKDSEMHKAIERISEELGKVLEEL